MSSETVDIAALVKAVEEAHAELLEANKRYNQAGSAQTAALNRANQAQRALDGAMESLRKGAPYGSDWIDRQRVR